MEHMGFRQAFLILGLAAAALAQDISAKADEYVAAFAKQNLFSGSVLVAQKGTIAFDKAYGMANYEWSVANTTDTKFRLGSVTKQFAAASVLKLEEMDKLKTSDKICDYLPACPEKWKPITIYHLLTHTSGIVNFTSLKDYGRLKGLPSRYDEQYNAVKDLDLEFDPGTKHKYSNSGYILLGQIIEKASGKPWEVFLQEQILAPAGMTNTRADSNTALIPKRASGYRGRGGSPMNAEFIDMRIPGAAGAMISTTGDLYKWDRALAAGRVLSEASMKKMWTVEKDNYALGWAITQDGGKTAQGHGGGIDGFSTYIHRVPEDGLLVVVLANFEDAQTGQIRQGLTRIARGETVELPKVRTEIQLDTATMDEYVGTYQLSPTFALTITREGNQLITQATGQGKLPVFAEAKDVLFPKAIPATLQIVRENGKVTGLILKQGGREMKATRNQ